MNKKTPHHRDQQISETFTTSPKAAYRMLFDSYYLKLTIYAQQLTGSYSLAEDIVQDFFVKFWEDKLYIRITGPYRYYLFTSIRNACMDQLRKKGCLSIEEIAPIEIEIPEDLEADELEAQKREKLLEAFHALPASERQAIRAVVMGDLSYKEAAASLDISVNTLKTHLARGIKKLRNQHLMLYLLVFGPDYL